VTDVLLWVMGAGTVGLIACVAVYSLFVREWTYRERLNMFCVGIVSAGLSWLFWFGGVDTVRAALFYMPEPVRSWLIWLARL
jgi:hypothetical protein